jgi:predicted 3-demethylubiquinone-9 3-methyltransferase (glyoxalase superfamily)
MTKNTVCIWYDGTAEEAAKFYAAVFPDSHVGAVHYAPTDYPSGKKGNALVVEFTVVGIPCIGLNGGSAVRQTEAFSFQISTDDQAETDRYWNAIIGNGGAESECGWCKDKWGVSWQITPKILMDALATGGGVAKRAFEAMMTMKKIDVAASSHRNLASDFHHTVCWQSEIVAGVIGVAGKADEQLVLPHGHAFLL